MLAAGVAKAAISRQAKVSVATVAAIANNTKYASIGVDTSKVTAPTSVW